MTSASTFATGVAAKAGERILASAREFESPAAGVWSAGESPRERAGMVSVKTRRTTRVEADFMGALALCNPCAPTEAPFAV